MQQCIQSTMLLFILFLAFLSSSTNSFLFACNVPVFRYALERWKPDVYEATLFHEGPLTSELKELLDVARKSDEHGRLLTNVRITTVDLSGELDEASRQIWNQQPGAKTPWLVVQFPRALQVERPMWAGAADATALEGLIDSPARKQLRQLLLDGTSTVWLVIGGINCVQNNSVVESLQKHLGNLEKSIKLPDESAQPGGVLKLPANEGEEMLSQIPLRIDFTVLQLDRQDPRESLFLANILQTDEGLAQEQGVVVVPIFGRGRALQAFPGSDLGPEMIAEAEQFLCGACSCSVKALNPGMDLLLTSPWEEVLAIGNNLSPSHRPNEQAEDVVATLVPIPSGVRPDRPSESNAVPSPNAISITDSPPSDSSDQRTGPWTYILVAGIVVAFGILIAQLRGNTNSAQ